MSAPAEFLSPSEAARKLGVSVKALRLYEQRGLISPTRNAAGWRAYGPDEMARGAEIAALRGLGFSLAQVAQVVSGGARALEQALAAHQVTLESRIREIAETVGRIGGMRDALADGQTTSVAEWARLPAPATEAVAAFDLPWPWGGERFELGCVRPLNYIIGPLFSGKTRFARLLAETLPEASFLGLDRGTDGGATARAKLGTDPALKSRVNLALARLVKDGAGPSDALIALLVELEGDGPRTLVIDMIEQGLDEASQHALIGHLRRRGPGARPLFLLTRSSAILDLAEVGAGEAIILCPANHNPPMHVAPYPGAPGYEAVATCLASPDVRARTEGVIALRPAVA